MSSNIEKYKKDFNALISQGDSLRNAMIYYLYKDVFIEQVEKKFKTEDEQKKFIKELPNFDTEYQTWYSESLVIIKQLLPDRLVDFMKLYEKPKTRKNIEYGNYVIEDYLQKLTVTSSYGDKKVDPSAALPQFEQQLSILNSLLKRFESSLFDIKQLVQADLFDSELDSAKELAKHKFVRAAGAISGVVLEKHLSQVTKNHNLNSGKKNATINDYNEILKTNNVIDIAQWRLIQLLGDIRNLCDHNKDKEPTLEQVNDLIVGVDKIIKTIF